MDAGRNALQQVTCYYIVYIFNKMKSRRPIFETCFTARGSIINVRQSHHRKNSTVAKMCRYKTSLIFNNFFIHIFASRCILVQYKFGDPGHDPCDQFIQCMVSGWSSRSLFANKCSPCKSTRGIHNDICVALKETDRTTDLL